MAQKQRKRHAAWRKRQRNGGGENSASVFSEIGGVKSINIRRQRNRLNGGG
jgi:hypothetical protein